MDNNNQRPVVSLTDQPAPPNPTQVQQPIKVQNNVNMPTNNPVLPNQPIAQTNQTNNLPSTTTTESKIYSVSSQEPEALINDQVVSQVSTSQSMGVKKPIIVSGLLVMIMAATISGYLFIPKYLTTQYINKVKPSIITLKSSTAEIYKSVGDIYASANESENPATQGSLKVTGLLLHPNLASVNQLSNVLGVSDSPGIVEENMMSLEENIQNSIKSLNVSGKNVAGASTSNTSKNDENARSLKDRSQAAEDKITQAKTDLKSSEDLITAQPVMLVGNAQQKVTKNTTLTTDVKPYIDEAAKVASYYKTLSDMVLTMDTDMTSFTTAISSFRVSFASLKSNMSVAQEVTILKQSQVYLNQAKKNASDIELLSQTLKNLPADSLPTGASKYHQHNIKILEAFTNYFDTIDKLEQNLVDSSNNILNKSDAGTLTANDIRIYQQGLIDVVKSASVADSQYLSDMQTLVGEEKPLSLNFWQDNGILTKGQKVQSDLDTLIHDMDSIK